MEASRTAITGVRIDHPAPSKASTAILAGAFFCCVVPNHFVRQALWGTQTPIRDQSSGFATGSDPAHFAPGHGWGGAGYSGDSERGDEDDAHPVNVARDHEAGLELVGRHLSAERAKAFQALGLRIVQGRREGVRIWDLDGNSCINCRSSGGVFNFGHRPAFAVQALERALHEVGDGPGGRRSIKSSPSPDPATTPGRLSSSARATERSQGVGLRLRSAGASCAPSSRRVRARVRTLGDRHRLLTRGQ